VSVPAEPIRTELSADAADYITGPTAGDPGTEGGTTKDGAVALYPRQSTVRPTDEGQQAAPADSSGA
jgi:hypothetical protein